MKLIIGGSFQGKSAYAVQSCTFHSLLIANGGTCTQQELLSCNILDDLHLYIRRLLVEDTSPNTIAEQISQLCLSNPELIMICNELGNGVVPMDAFDRLYRETVGRICCHLAKTAEQVIRVTCGIPIILK